MLLETYSSLDSDRLKECLPKFLNIVKEVTGAPDYSMFNLSLREDWSKTEKFCRSLHGMSIVITFIDCIIKHRLFVLDMEDTGSIAKTNGCAPAPIRNNLNVNRNSPKV